MMRVRNPLVRTTGLGLALATALALGAGPLLAECYTMYGSPRECTPSEQFDRCLANADDAMAQCGGRTFFSRAGCGMKWGVDRASCGVDLVRNFLL